MFATQASSHAGAAPSYVGAAHSEPSLAELHNVKNLAELTAHWQKLQHFVQQWGTRQEQLLMCGDTNALVDAKQIHLMEVESMGEDGRSQGANNLQFADEFRTPATPASTNMNGTVGTPDAVDDAASVHSPCSFDLHQSQISQLHNFHSKRSSVALGASSLVHSVVTRKGFDVLCGVVIFTNAIMTGWSSDNAIKNPLQKTPLFLVRCDTFFIAFYTFEIGLRMLDQRYKYLTGADRFWNMFDVVLVIQGLTEQMLALMESSGDGLANFSFLRLLRLMKMLKLLRMVRLLRMFRELRLILSSIFACVTSMLWTFVLILAITYLFGIAFMQSCTGYLQLPGDNIDPKVRADIQMY